MNGIVPGTNMAARTEDFDDAGIPNAVTAGVMLLMENLRLDTTTRSG